MTHLDKGKYFQKHSNQAKVDDSLRQEIMQKAKENNIACAVAEEISQRKEMTLGEVGMAIDLLNINLVECQLGLFGYSPQKKIVQPANEVVPVLKENICAALDNSRLPCI